MSLSAPYLVRLLLALALSAAQVNPYRTIDDWAKLPRGVAIGQAAGVDVDRDGNVWIAQRCGSNTCNGRNDAPILQFDRSGNLIRSFGSGMFVFPHGIFADPDGNIYVSDSESDTARHPGWKRGIRIGSARDGIVRAFIPDPAPPDGPASTSGEGVAADSNGSIYAVELTPPGIKKHVR